MPSDGEASVTPNQDWTSNGTALVAPRPPFPNTEPRLLPLENRAVQGMTISRSRYPDGLVIIPRGNPPPTSPAMLPIKASNGSEIRIDGDTYAEWPDGIVAWFFE